VPAKFAMEWKSALDRGKGHCRKTTPCSIGKAKAALRRNDSAARPVRPPYVTHEERASATWHIFYNTREKGRDAPKDAPAQVPRPTQDQPSLLPRTSEKNPSRDCLEIRNWLRFEVSGDNVTRMIGSIFGASRLPKTSDPTRLAIFQTVSPRSTLAN
jgi:hypothetical protein